MLRLSRVVYTPEDTASHITMICFNTSWVVEVGLAFKAGPVGMVQQQQIVFLEMVLVPHPVGAEDMSAEFRPLVAMEMLQVVWMANALLVPARPSTNNISDGGVSSSVSPRFFHCW